MNINVSAPPAVTAGTIPRELAALCSAPHLLPGEDLGCCEALRAVIFRDLAPQSAIEWLLATDIAEIAWEIQRYRLLRQRLFEVYRQKAVEVLLRRIDLAGADPTFREEAEIQTARNALSWQIDRKAAREIDERLSACGFDHHAVSMEVYVQSREAFDLFETLINAAQLRRLLLLKEITNYRRVRADKRHGQRYRQGRRNE